MYINEIHLSQCFTPFIYKSDNYDISTMLTPQKCHLRMIYSYCWVEEIDYLLSTIIKNYEWAVFTHETSLTTHMLTIERRSLLFVYLQFIGIEFIAVEKNTVLDQDLLI
jgi:hypothetical protein